LREVEAQKAAEKQAEDNEASARVHEARDAIAHRDTDGEDAPPVSEKRKKGSPRRRDLTVLILFGIVAAAGIAFYWLAQRPTKAQPAPAPSASAPAARMPVHVTLPHPSQPAAPAPVTTVAPESTMGLRPAEPGSAPYPGAPTVNVAVPPAAPAEAAPAQPAPAKPAPAKPAPAKPAPKKAESADPYG
jgi:hypothetical protein